MPHVDFGNEYLRFLLESGAYLAGHASRLCAIEAELPALAAAARAGPAEGRPLAAVVDVDEVVLANIHTHVFQGATADGRPVDFHAADHYAAPGGGAWPRDEQRLNPLLPGAQSLISALRALDICVFFVTGRAESLRAETVENFIFVGLASPAGDGAPAAALRAADLSEAPDLAALPRLGAPAAGSALVMHPTGTAPNESVRPFKTACRAAIAATHHTILTLGDQASDMGEFSGVQAPVANPFYFTL
jgi:predicted secreted acid phosphatase